MLQTVIEYDLNDFVTEAGAHDFGEAHRHLTYRFEELDPGTMVRLKVHTHRPLPGYVPIARADLLLQIVSSDPDIAKAWRQMLEAEAPIGY